MASKHYINNAEFETYLARHREIDGKPDFKKEQEEIETKLCEFFQKIASGVVSVLGTGSYDCDDAIQEGVLICLLKFRKFTPGKGKAFNYCTTMVWNHFRQMHRSYTSHRVLLAKFANYLANSSESEKYQLPDAMPAGSGLRQMIIIANKETENKPPQRS